MFAATTSQSTPRSGLEARNGDRHGTDQQLASSQDSIASQPMLSRECHADKLVMLGGGRVAGGGVKNSQCAKRKAQIMKGTGIAV